MRIRTKLMAFVVLLSLGSAALLASYAFQLLAESLRARLQSGLTVELEHLELALKLLPGGDSTARALLAAYASGPDTRLSLYDRQARLLYDSALPARADAGAAPEVSEALRSGLGSASRPDSSGGREQFYVAKRASDPAGILTPVGPVAVLRIGVSTYQMKETLANVRNTLVAVGILTILIVAALSVLISRKISSPMLEMVEITDEIRSGNLDRRLPIRSNDEFGALAGSLNGMVDKLNEDIAKLKKLERVRSEFLGNVSHELRTPIFAMQGMLETLLQGALEDKEVRRDFVERVLANTQRLNSLLGDLIEISRIESGEMKMSFRYFNVNEFLESAVAELRSTAAQKSITLSIGPEHADHEVFGDKERLKQVMINLVDNAIKYTPAGGNVAVGCSPVKNGVRISVSDTGIGIPESHRSRIFERFYRVDRERSREAGGTGLGLAIVKHIVEAHGSRVELESEVGKGSTFSFSLKS